MEAPLPIMNDKLISEIEKALRAEFEEKKRKLDAELKKRLEALRVVAGRPPAGAYVIVTRDAAKMTISDHEKFSTSNGHRVAGLQEISMKKATTEALNQVSGNFSVRDLVPIIQGIYPGMEVTTGLLANPMWLLKKAGKIELVSKGIGREPNVYKKV